ncbi:hypothetical protein CcI49_03725 [Frankia sp. CcI49]|nr:hypothetical protein ACG83_17975 [Frankia sp. R43]ONH61918.1 hypothetical protein CcI49_03725 [Frankia sp. CcI49]
MGEGTAVADTAAVPDRPAGPSQTGPPARLSLRFRPELWSMRAVLIPPAHTGATSTTEPADVAHP